MRSTEGNGPEIICLDHFTKNHSKTEAVISGVALPKRMYILFILTFFVLNPGIVFSQNREKSTEEEYVIKKPGNQSNPLIWGNRIVWEDDRTGNGDLYPSAGGGDVRITSGDCREWLKDLYKDTLLYVTCDYHLCYTDLAKSTPAVHFYAFRPGRWHLLNRAKIFGHWIAWAEKDDGANKRYCCLDGDETCTDIFKNGVRLPVKDLMTGIDSYIFNRHPINANMKEEKFSVSDGKIIWNENYAHSYLIDSLKFGVQPQPYFQFRQEGYNNGFFSFSDKG